MTKPELMNMLRTLAAMEGYLSAQQLANGWLYEDIERDIAVLQREILVPSDWPAPKQTQPYPSDTLL